MFAISMLFQIVGILSGIYLMFAESFGRGLALVAAIVILHWLFSILTNFSLYLHQKTLSEDEMESMAFFANRGMMKEASPRAWRVISNISAVLFWIAAGGIIIWFLTD